MSIETALETHKMYTLETLSERVAKIDHNNLTEADDAVLTLLFPTASLTVMKFGAAIGNTTHNAEIMVRACLEPLRIVVESNAEHELSKRLADAALTLFAIAREYGMTNKPVVANNDAEDDAA
jgi:hypothetical protein